MAIPRVLVAVLISALIATHLSVCGATDDTLRPVPELHARVTDLTGTLDAQQTQSLQAHSFDAGTAQGRADRRADRADDDARVDRTVRDARVRCVEARPQGASTTVRWCWSPRQDRHVRIEVGYGLEGAIPDAAAKRIAHDYMSPRFADGDFARRYRRWRRDADASDRRRTAARAQAASALEGVVRDAVCRAVVESGRSSSSAYSSVAFSA